MYNLGPFKLKKINFDTQVHLCYLSVFGQRDKREKGCWIMMM